MAMPGVRRIVALVVAVFLLSGVAPLQSEGAVWFVTQNGAGTKHGGSWSNAMGESEFVQTLQLVQPAGTEFWIAKGTYRPTADPNNRDAAFVLKNGVALYGGFAGNETQRKERDWNANPTYLSGEIQNDGSLWNNSLHVVFAEIGTDGTAVLDGFVITGGNADGGALQDTHGGGMINFGDPGIANCTFLGNWARLGGGLFNQGSASVVTGCTFLQNTAREDGGGMYNTAGNLSIAGCTFYGNIAYSLGGGMKNRGSNPVVEASTFRQNMAHFGGGGMSNEECGAVAVNCTFYNNRAGVIGGGNAHPGRLSQGDKLHLLQKHVGPRRRGPRQPRDEQPQNKEHHLLGGLHRGHPRPPHGIAGAVLLRRAGRVCRRNLHHHGGSETCRSCRQRGPDLHLRPSRGQFGHRRRHLRQCPSAGPAGHGPPPGFGSRHRGL